MGRELHWVAALLVSAAILSLSQPFVLRPLKDSEPLDSESVPKKRSVYVHSIKNNFYPGDEDVDDPDYPKPGGYYTPGYQKPAYPKQSGPKPSSPKLGYPKPDYPQQYHPKPDYPQQYHPKPDYPQQYHPKPGYSQQDHPKPDYSQQYHPKPDYPQQYHPKPDYSQQYHPKPDYPQQDHPKPDYSQQDCPNLDDPKPDYTTPDYTPPDSVKPDTYPAYSTPTFPVHECTTPKATPDTASKEQSLVATIRGLIKEILQQEKAEKSPQTARTAYQEVPPQPSGYQPKTNHYNRLHAHYPLTDGPLRRPYTQGRKIEVYEEENHRLATYRNQDHHRSGRDSDPQVTEAQQTTETPADAESASTQASVPAEPLILQDVLNNVKVYLDLISGSGFSTDAKADAAIEQTVAAVVRDVISAVRENRKEIMTTTEVPTTEATTTPTVSPLEQALAELDASLKTAREELEKKAAANPATENALPAPESPTGLVGTNFPQISDNMVDLLEKFGKLTPPSPAPVIFEQKAAPIAFFKGQELKSDVSPVPIIVPAWPNILNGVPIVRESPRQLRQNYAQDQNDVEEVHEDVYSDRPRPNYALVPRMPHAVRRYERHQNCPAPSDVARPRYQEERPRQIRPRPQERGREEPMQAPHQYRQNVYRRPVPVPYPVEDVEEEDDEEDEDEGYGNEGHGYPENEAQCYPENNVRY